MIDFNGIKNYNISILFRMIISLVYTYTSKLISGSKNSKKLEKEEKIEKISFVIVLFSFLIFLSGKDRKYLPTYLIFWYFVYKQNNKKSYEKIPILLFQFSPTVSLVGIFFSNIVYSFDREINTDQVNKVLAPSLLKYLLGRYFFFLFML